MRDQSWQGTSFNVSVNNTTIADDCAISINFGSSLSGHNLVLSFIYPLRITVMLISMVCCRRRPNTLKSQLYKFLRPLPCFPGLAVPVIVHYRRCAIDGTASVGLTPWRASLISMSVWALRITVINCGQWFSQHRDRYNMIINQTRIRSPHNVVPF